MPIARRSSTCWNNWRQSARTIPGVTAAGITTQVPMGPGGNGNGLLREGLAFEAQEPDPSRLRMVTPEYFAAMRIPIVKGRAPDGRRPPRRPARDGRSARRWRAPRSRARTRSAGGSRAASPAPTARARRSRSWSASPATCAGAVRPRRRRPSSTCRSIRCRRRRGNGYSAPPTSSSAPISIRRAMADPLARVVREHAPGVPVFQVRTMEERLQGAMATARFNTHAADAAGRASAWRSRRSASTASSPTS